MLVVYLIFSVFGAVALTADFILRYMEKIRSFGLEKRIIRFTGKTIPIEYFLPENLTILFLNIMVFGISGLILEAVGFGIFLSLPCSLVCGAFACFAVQRFVTGIKGNPRDSLPPKNAELTGLDAAVLQSLPTDGYGQIKVLYDGRIYKMNAVSANHTVIHKGERATVVLYCEGMCFVERQDEVLSPPGINEEEENNEQENSSADREH